MPAPVDTTPSAQGKRKRPQKDKTPVSQGTKRVKSIHEDKANASLNNNGNASVSVTPVPVKQPTTLATSSAKKDKKKKAVDTPSKSTELVQDHVAAQSGEKATRRLRRDPTKKKRSLAAPAALKETTIADSDGAWSASKPAGGRFIAHDPIVSSDDNFVLASNGREVQVLSVATSLVERVLPGPDHSVAAFALSATDSENIYIASSTTRRVQCWDWTSGAAINEPVEYNGRLHALCVAASDDGTTDDLYTICQTGEEWHIMAGNRSIYTSQQRLANLSLDASYIIASSPNKLIVGQRIAPKPESDQEAHFTFIEISSPIEITCLAGRAQAIEASKKKSGPAGSFTVATGNVEGQIMVYEDIFSAAKPGATLTPRVLHWHREAVASLKWSNDGNYIISGGRETTLVLWQLVTGKKQFLPHLTAEIERLTVSPSGTSYAIQLADNSVMVLSTTELKPTANFAGLQAQTAVEKSITPAAAVLHPVNKHELLLAVPASQRAASRPFLQTYDIASDRHISRQALTRNNVTDFNKGPEGNKIQVPDVTYIKISQDGQWLATVEEWSPPAIDLDFLSSDRNAAEQRIIRREVYLKFWRWDAERSLWALETRIDNPHQIANGAQPGHVFGLLSDPVESGFATIGEDSSIRVWKPKTRLRGGLVIRGANAEGLVDWSCRHTIQLDQSVNLTEEDSTSGLLPSPKSAAFAYSEDGSMLAASQAFEETSVPPVVHFINTASGAVEQTRPNLFTGAIKALDFLDRHLILVSDSGIHLWDVIDETLKYRTGLASDSSLSTMLLAVNQEDRTFALSISSLGVARIRVYNTSSPQPELKRAMNKPVSALITATGRKGYTVLTTSAEVQTLAPKVSAFTLPTAAAISSAIAASEPLESADEEEEEEEEEDVDMELEGGQDVLALDEEEADKPVVRPEDLARVFDSENIALVPVRDMFDAVVGLYARKPRQTVAA